MEDLNGNAVYDALFQAQMAPNPESLGVAHMLETTYPALKHKIFDNGDDLIKAFTLTRFNPIKVMNMPLCGRCESLAYRFEDGYKDARRVETCMCRKCGTRTYAPVHFRDWLRDELRHKMPKGTEGQLDDNFLDAQAVVQVTRAMGDYLRLQQKINMERNAQMGAPDVGVTYHETKPFSGVRVRELTPDEVDRRKPELDSYFKKRGAVNG